MRYIELERHGEYNLRFIEQECSHPIQIEQLDDGRNFDAPMVVIREG